jgi:15-cis-phytoene synthase
MGCDTAVHGPDDAQKGRIVTDTVEQAYRTCEEITRDQARNFFYGIRLLPTDKRGGLCALYALSRRVDDIGDGDLSLDDKAAALADVRTSLKDIDTSTDPVLVAVSDTARRFPVPMGAFDELVDGVEMDLSGRRYQTFGELVTYCRCVAGSIGRLCLGVFGSRPDPAASDHADALGIALQQTNILRDIREDLVNGRIYLPQDDLDFFDVRLRLDEDGALVDPDGGLARLIESAAERARTWYDQGFKLLPSLDRRSAACTGAMSGIYRRLLDRIAADPAMVYDRRLSLSGWEKAGVAARALVGARA